MEFWMDGQGEISVAQGRPIPPFERWSFTTNHYIQFLQDQVFLFSLSTYLCTMSFNLYPNVCMLSIQDSGSDFLQTAAIMTNLGQYCLE
jgi:hypothetical protein